MLQIKLKMIFQKHRRTIKVGTANYYLVNKGLLDLFNSSKEMRCVVAEDTVEGLFSSMMDPGKVPDVLLVNTNLERITGVQIMHKLELEYPAVKVIAMTSCSETMHMIEMLKAGAYECIDAHMRDNDLLDVVKKVHLEPEYYIKIYRDRNRVLTPEEKAFIECNFNKTEIQFLQLNAECHSLEKISKLMSIPLEHVNLYLKNISKKLEAYTRYEMVLNALRKGLIRLKGMGIYSVSTI